jgi:hypothetical protein
MNQDRKRLAKTAILVCVGAAGLATVNAANGEATARSAKPLVFKLNAKHGSAISGVATLTAAGKRVRVVLQLRGRSLNNLPAHIHTGPCRREPTFANPRIWSGLNSVVNGKSVTTLIRTSMARLRARAFSINVHNANTLAVVACGDIPRAERRAR